MNVLKTEILRIIKKALFTDFEYTPNPTLSWDQIIKIGSEHGLIPILAEGLLSSQIDDDTKSRLLAEYRRHALVHFGQMERLGAITKAFSDLGIDFMLLKGKNLKELYPKPEMRIMGDFDILIKTDQYDKIQKALSSLGLFKVLESDHEIIWQDRGFAFLELHKHLLPSYNPDFCEYFGTGWERAKQKDSSSEFYLSKEDEYIFVFTHLSKHYRDGGIGIRHMLDIYLFGLKNPSMDSAYIETELKKLGLFDFHKNIKHTLSVWFDSEASSEISDLITSKIFQSGSYGSAAEKTKASALRAANRHKTKLGAILATFFLAAFPKPSVMKKSYPILNSFPVLLPIIWLVRILRGAIFKQKTLKNEFSKIKTIESSALSDYQDELSKVGLNDKF